MALWSYRVGFWSKGDGRGESGDRTGPTQSYTQWEVGPGIATDLARAELASQKPETTLAGALAA
jgi:hypothetical protein